MELKVRDTWRFEPPEPIPFNADGSVSFGGRVGDVVLPEDYVALMARRGPVTFEGEDNACIAVYEDSNDVVVVEYLLDLSSVSLQSRMLYESAFHDSVLVPPGFIVIASGEIEDIVMNVDPNGPDFGRVYARERAQDPWGEGDNTRGLGLIADSFTEFMNELTQEDAL